MGGIDKATDDRITFMRVLLVKLTSMGDLIHALPALTDASRHIPGIRFDWVVDKNFSEIATWHPAVQTVIPSRHRYWRKHFVESMRNGEIQQFLKSVRAETYDLILDGQTSLKSAFVTLLGRGPRCGLDKHSAREGWLPALAYQKSYFVPRKMHAIQRLRQLFSAALNYPCPTSEPDYGIRDFPFPPLKFALPDRYLVFVHNASWASKLWPEFYWRELIEIVNREGFHVLLPWGNQEENLRATRIAAGYPDAHVLPFCTLSEHARILLGAAGAIGSDTGLSHLAASLSVPSVTLYGSTDVALIGTIGLNQQQLVSPFSCTRCYQHECHFGHQTHADALCSLEIKPEKVWEIFKKNS